jgi:hypothetical protein
MRVWRNDMSPEIDLLNTYRVVGQERLRTLYHLEAAKNWQGSDVEVPVYDIPVDVRIAMAVARLSKERLQCAEPEVELMQAA